MSLFQCSKCGCCENTACCKYHYNRAYRKDLGDVCSACDPDMDGWHGKFARTFLPKGEFLTNREGNLQHVRTGRIDFYNFAIPEPAEGKP